MFKINKIPLWFKGGCLSSLFYILITFLISHFDSIKENILVRIITVPLLILSLPLLILYAYIGFAIDLIFNTGVGYESLGMFPQGIIFMKISSIIYFFFVGVLIIKIYEIIKKKNL
ncbi:MAG TPA: hypothetical protein HA283_03205 [Nanoarchaeota archaeon]|nr:hypothetical protein [Nanoarchaeota archaeon]HIH63282.1 hypothetical protein [Nanoarchaeota archaeon]HIJ09278.1 hypothetical protein [Nanoarchaeota archaeon]